jgi:glutathione S-transferase
MRVFHSPGTRSTRVLWTLEEVGAPYDVTVLTLEERRGSEHRRRHPLGRVPVVELDDGRLMHEAAAICLHIADLHPSAGVAPSIQSPDRPILYQWLMYAITELEPTLGRWNQSRRNGTADEEHHDAAAFFERAHVLEERVTSNPWILGETFSIVDMFVARPLNSIFDQHITNELPALEAHWRRALMRPAHQRADAIGR